MFVGNDLDTVSCEIDPENDESSICKGALEQRWGGHYVLGRSIVRSWRKKDCLRTYRTSFIIVPDQSMDCDIKFGANWERGAPIQEKERKRKTAYGTYCEAWCM